MRWQRVAQAAIALFVIGFIALLATTLRQERSATPEDPAPTREKPDAPLENPGGGTQEATDPTGKKRWGIRFGTHVALADGRQQLGGGVEATINRADRHFVIRAREAEITPSTEGVKDAVFKGEVVVKGTDGLELKTAEATYTEADGLIRIPGAVQFSKGRTSGSGRDSTYDQAREIFWIQRDARVDVAAGEDGGGALEASANAIGMARLDHYIRLQGSGRIEGEGRLLEADDITIRLTEDDERVRSLELRGSSRITSTDGRGQSMSARDIDMTYSEDGRTLQAARLVENAVLQLPGSGKTGGKRITARTIDLGLAPDGSTISSLAANQRVQVDLPAEGDAPAKTIQSATLHASGGENGVDNATFAGGVEYHERRAARRNLPAIDRTARAQTLIAQTQPGLGSIERADFRGNVRMTEPPDFVAEAPQALYDPVRNRLELMPGENLPGPPSPSVTDGSISVAARTIQFGLATRELSADTKVRSTIRPEKRSTDRSTDRKLPSVLSGDAPVNVTSNRLNYKGKGTPAEYSGNVTMWQGSDTTIKAPTIAIDDETGNLRATGGVTTSFPIQDANAKQTDKTPQVTIGSSEAFAYDEAKRLATYEGKAQISGPQGDVSGEKIELFLKEGVNELERAEAYGPNGAVQVREANRLAKGSHLTYTAADDRYLMIGSPVEIIEESKGTCRMTQGTSVTFNRASERATIEGSVSGGIPSHGQTLKACPAGLGR
jgi:lipopolysaccharide transport protein LptA